MSTPRVIHVQSADEIERIVALAHATWTQHYTSIIGPEQVDYMLAKFQSAAAIQEQLEVGYRYRLLADDQRDLAYMALVPEDSAVMISKIYVHAEARGWGLGKQLLAIAQEEALALNASRLWLTVNKSNHQSIEWYTHQGFTVEKEQVADIGQGYVMDDYIMGRNIR